MRRVLLDTHVFVWALASPERIPAAGWTLLEDEEVDFLLSTASGWELAIKSALRKIVLPGGVRAFVADGCRSARVSMLSVDLSHLHVLESLPFHHRDPFDRMIIAQALGEGIPVLSYDRAFDGYGIARA